MAEDFTLPAFLQDCDVDTIHQRMMDMLPDDIDKTEAGFPWDFTRPTALIASELLEYYIPETLKLMFPQWSSGEFLDYLANMARLARKAPNFASVTIEITGEPGTIIATGTVFATPATEEVESIEFATEEACVLNENGTGTVIARAMIAGVESNVNASGTCLKPGDILLNDNHHVAIAVSGDASSNATPAKKNYLEKGDSGSEVTTMQKMLIKVGYSCGSAGADGDFGSGTDEALRKFQKDNGLVVDGQYGTNSKAKLTALYNKKVGTTTSTKKDVTTVAKEVIAGKWGSGDERKKKLTAAGYNYDTVQKKVNELLKASTKKSVAEVAKEVVSGKWGNGADRKKKLEAAGYNYSEVQKEVNKLLK